MKDENTIKWRLAEKPTPDNLLKLIEGGVITKEEAKKIVLDESVVSQSDIEAIKAEMSLLRKMVLEISEKTNTQKEIIRIFEKEIPVYIDRYKYISTYPRAWWNDGIAWCNSQINSLQSVSGTTQLASSFPNIQNAVSKLNLQS